MENCTMYTRKGSNHVDGRKRGMVGWLGLGEEKKMMIGKSKREKEMEMESQKTGKDDVEEEH